MNSEGEYLKDEGVKCPPAYLKMLYWDNNRNYMPNTVQSWVVKRSLVVRWGHIFQHPCKSETELRLKFPERFEKRTASIKRLVVSVLTLRALLGSFLDYWIERYYSAMWEKCTGSFQKYSRVLGDCHWKHALFCCVRHIHHCWFMTRPPGTAHSPHTTELRHHQIEYLLYS
jgi:hypothetical protein